MSTLAAVLTLDTPAPGEAATRGMLAASARRGAARSEVASVGGASLGVARHEWELVPGIAGRALLAVDGRITVAADAALYYGADLLRALRGAGVEPAGQSPGHLIAAAYRAWGADCPRHLEGDYAFVLVDAERGRVLAARDWVGTRPLFWARLGSTLVIGSTVGAVLAHPACPHDLDVVAAAGQAAGLLGAAERTAYAHVQVFGAGCALLAERGRPGEPTRFWEPPTFAGERVHGASSFDDAAAELRSLLADAVEERMGGAGATSVSLSGGWDSSSIYAAGHDRLRSRGESADRLVATSMSFPPGDVGREDELIESILGHWGTTTRWIDTAAIDLLEALPARIAARDELFAHPYEMTNRALAQSGVAQGARVQLSGYGGDQFFSCDPFYLADQLTSGSLLAHRREWRAVGLRGAREWVRWAVQPALPGAALALVARARGGRPLRNVLDPVLPPWIDERFAREHDLLGRASAAVPARGDAASAAAYEKLWYLLHPYFPRIASLVAEIQLEAGVESRSPMMDERVVRFMASRPRGDRRRGSENKVLLRAAMRGLLPDDVLAPRTHRTGTTGDLARRSMYRSLLALAVPLSEDPVLVKMGVIDRRAFRRALERFARGDDTESFGIFAVVRAELWLRSRAGAVPHESRMIA